MKSFDFYAVVYDCEVYCLECLPDGVEESDYEPVFADSEWDYYPVCVKCSTVHDYMSLTTYGQEEHDKRQKEDDDA